MCYGRGQIKASHITSLPDLLILLLDPSYFIVLRNSLDCKELGAEGWTGHFQVLRHYCDLTCQFLHTSKKDSENLQTPSSAPGHHHHYILFFPFLIPSQIFLRCHLQSLSLTVDCWEKSTPIFSTITHYAVYLPDNVVIRLSKRVYFSLPMKAVSNAF